MTVLTPLWPARRAACSLVVMPPVPSLLPAPPGHGHGGLVDTFEAADEAGVAVAAGVGSEHAGLVGEQDEEVGFQEVGDEGGEVVVIADADFVHGGRVVFIDDGDDAALDHGEQGIAGIEVAGAVVEVAAGEQDLADDDVMGLEERAVELHEAALTDGGEHLAQGQGTVQGGEAQALATGGLGAGGYDDDFVVMVMELRDAGDESLHELAVEIASATGEDTAAQLTMRRMGEEGRRVSAMGLRPRRRAAAAGRRAGGGRERGFRPGARRRCR